MPLNIVSVLKAMRKKYLQPLRLRSPQLVSRSRDLYAGKPPVASTLQPLHWETSLFWLVCSLTRGYLQSRRGTGKVSGQEWVSLCFSWTTVCDNRWAFSCCNFQGTVLSFCVELCGWDPCVKLHKEYSWKTAEYRVQVLFPSALDWAFSDDRALWQKSCYCNDHYSY